MGKTYSGDSEVYSFNLQADSISLQPPFVNLQQFYVEWYLVDRIGELGGAELRWKNRVIGIEPAARPSRSIIAARTARCTSSICARVGVKPVPIAQTGS